MSDPKFTDEQKQMLQLKARLRHHAMLVNIGNFAGAAKYAEKFSLPPGMLTSAPGIAPAPEKVEMPKKKAVAAKEETAVELVNGWPVDATGTIIAHCPNPRFDIVLLRDGRTASVWRSNYAVRANVRVVLDKRLGDPIYKVTGAL